MAKLKWLSGSMAEINETFGSAQCLTNLEVDKERQIVHILQDEDHVALTQSEAKALVSYLNSVIPSMKEI